MITPYLQAAAQTNEDAFNFYHSSARITVECAFGEIDLRWGIFWKRLMCSLEHASIIIEGAMCLHNYLVDYRENGDEKSVDSEREIFIQDVRDRYVTPMQVGNDNVQLMGRPNNEDREKRLRGKLLRDSLSQALADHDMKRRRKNWTENEYSHVVINS